MIKTKEELFKILSSLKIEYVNHEHPAVFTVDEANKHQAGIKGVHSKNLFFKDKKHNLFLIVTLANKAISIKEVAKKIGAKNMSFGKSELLEQVLGITPGSVTPFAVINAKENELKVILDKEMMENKLLNFHPLINTSTTSILSNDLIKFMEYCSIKFDIIRL